MPLDTQSTTLAQSPYFDDFNENKNFHRVLFKPSVAVQARELTQLQTILQNQIERFGDNIFKNGTIIKGCSITTDPQYYYVKLVDTRIDGTNLGLASLSNTVVKDTTSNLTALVVNYATGSLARDPDLNTIYVKYLNTGTAGQKQFSNSATLTFFTKNYSLQSINIVSGGADYSNSDTVSFTGGGGSGASGSIVTFANGAIRTIAVTNGGTGYTQAPTVNITTSTGTGANVVAINYITQINVANNAFTEPVGIGFAAKTSEGIVYQKGHFIRVESQEVVVSKYNTSPNNVVIGFATSESIVNSNLDSTLLDNAGGFTNFVAPGADRLKLTANLVSISKNSADANTNFLSLYEFENGFIVKDRTATQFNSINKELSKRTFEESGNYVVDPIPLYAESLSGNTTHFNLVVGAGLAYVEGNRVQIYNNTRIPIRKSTDFNTEVSQTISTSYGGYVVVKELFGVFGTKNGATVSLRNVAGEDITDNAGNSPTLPGTQIGTAKVRSIAFDSGVPGTPTCEYRLYLFDVRMTQGYSFKDVRSIAESGNAVADVVIDPVSGGAELRDIENDTLIFNSGTFAVRALQDEIFSFRTSTSGQFISGGTMELSFAGGESPPYTSGANVTAVQERDFVVVPTQTLVGSIAKTGNVAITSGSANVVGTGTLFTAEYTIGDFIKIGSQDPKRIVNISSNNALIVDSNYGASVSNQPHYISFPANVPINFQGVAGRTIAVTDTTLVFDLGTTLTSSGTASVFHDLRTISPSVRVKSINNPVYVKLSTDSLSLSQTGPWCVGVTDAIEITGVYVGTSNSYSNTSTNYASEFILDNGQKDNFYGLSYISKRPTSSLSLSNTSCLLVELKTFSSGEGKYVSTESYSSAIDDTSVPLPSNRIRTEQIPIFVSPRDGKVVDLRDAIDFRPFCSNTANVSSTVAGATIDPSSTVSFDNSDKYFPSPLREFSASIQSYKKRIDRVVLDSYGNLSILEGIPADSPSAPSQPKGTITLGIINISQYPSLPPKEASEAGRSDLGVYITFTQDKRYTMQDIGSIDRRIERLEYYTLLNTLEQDTKDLSIPSEANTSIERFKNGFFVDPMTDYSISNLNDPEYSFIIDRNESIGRPKFTDHRIDLIFSNSSVGTTRNGDLIHLDYSEKLLVSQDIGNKQRNLTEQYWKFRGNVGLFPQFDNYYDITRNAVSIAIDIATPLNALAAATSEALSQLNVSTSLDKIVNVGNPIHVGTRGGNDVFVQNVQKTITDTKVKINPGQQNITVQDLGDFVTDFTVKPFIRDQRIYFYAYGLRPNTRMFVFFDGQNLSAQCAPATLTYVSGNANNLYKEIGPTSFLVTGTVGANLVANSSGELGGFLDLPPNRFFVGERDFVLLDVNNTASESAATTKAHAKFVAFSYGVNKTNLSVSTKTIDVSFDKPFSVSNYTNTYVVSDRITFERPRPDPDPLSQTFKVQRQLANSDGIFVSSIDVFFARKDEEKGVTLELRETNNGVPSHIVVPFSRVRLPSSSVTASNNGSVSTKFTFDSLVYLKTETDYAIVMYPDANSPEYLVWTAETGVPDAANSALVSNQNWGLGTLFYSTSGTAWTPVQDEDLKFKVNRALFDDTTGTVELNNGDYEFLSVNSALGAFKGGEDVVQIGNSYLGGYLTVVSGNNTIQTSTDLSSFLPAGDNVTLIVGNNSVKGMSNVNVSSVTISNGGSQTTDFTNEYSAGDFIRIGTEIRQVLRVSNSSSLTIDSPFVGTYSNAEHYRMSAVIDSFRVITSNTTSFVVNKLPSFSSNTSVIINAQKSVKGIVDYYNPSIGSLHIKESTASNGSFKFVSSSNTYYGLVVGTTSQAKAKVINLENLSANLFRPLINTLVVPGTSVSMTGSFTGQTGGELTSSYVINGSNKISFNDSAIIKSKSNEIVGGTATKSFTASFNMSTFSRDISPIIDINPSSIIISKNEINNTSNGENTNYGSALCKYISKRIILADGQDAEDARVYVTAYRPSGTFVDVYAKILSSTDGEPFNSKGWTLLDMITPASLYSSSANERDFREYEYRFPFSPASIQLAGVVTSYSNTTISGSDTNFTLSLVAGDLVKIVKSSSLYDYDIVPILTVDSGTQLTLADDVTFTGSGNRIEKVTDPRAAFKYSRGNIVQNGAVVRYFDSVNGAHDRYKYLAIKIVLRSNFSFLVPTINDVRAIALSV